jgi:uncharacterized protein YjlB
MGLNDKKFNSVEYVILKDDGFFPNNGKLPLILYKRAIDLTGNDCNPISIEEILHRNGWGSSWRNGIYSIHHYHSTAHEVLGVYSGEAVVCLGGEKGVSYKVGAGDFVVIPAGVAHKCLTASDNFRVVGAYPPGQKYDTCYGKQDERPQADRNIALVPIPETDPVYGTDGPLKLLWSV